MEVLRWKISGNAPVYALALVAIGFGLSANIFLFQAFGSFAGDGAVACGCLVVVLALFFFYRFVGNEELPQDEAEVRWWEIK
jgi:hypothetical protein